MRILLSSLLGLAALRRMICLSIVVLVVAELPNTVRGQEKTIDDVGRFPAYQQEDSISCGPVSVSMVLKYFGVDAGIGPLKTKCGTRFLEVGSVRVGLTLPGGIKNGLEGYGAKGEVKSDATMDDVQRAIDANRPPILLVRSSDRTWHYIVVIGYSRNESGRLTLMVADPSSSRVRRLAAEDVNKGWTFSGTYEGTSLDSDPDLFRKAVELAKVRGNTMIIPSRGPK